MRIRKNKVSHQEESEEEQMSLGDSEGTFSYIQGDEDDDSVLAYDTSSEYELSEDYDEDYDGDSYSEQSEIVSCIREAELDEGSFERLNSLTDKKQILHIVASSNREKLFKKLLSVNEDKVNYQNKKKKTPLHIAAKYDRRKITEHLIEKGADITIEDSKEFSPLLTAVKYGNADIFGLLIKEMDVNEIQEFLMKKIMFEKDSKTNDSVKLALNPIQIAVKYNREKVAEELIDLDKSKIWENITYGKGHNIVYLATKNNNAKVLRVLLEKCPKEFIKKFSNGEIMEENESEHKELSSEAEEMVSEEHSDENKKMVSEEHPDENKRNDKRTKKTPLLVAAQKGYFECLNLLIENKANLQQICKGGKTALHLAAKNGDIRVVESLLKAEPVLKHLKDDEKRRPLHDAISHVKVVEILINSKAKLDKQDKNGRTPLSYAAEKGKLESTRKLIEKGADINLEDQKKMRPIHYAAIEGHSELFKVLATNKHIDLSNLNCLQLAIDHNHEETAFAIFQIEKTKWQYMMQSRSRCENSSNEYDDTPMRKLIRKMPNVAKEVFNRCTEIMNDKNKPFQVTFCYKFLDDTYDLGEWDKYRTENQAAEIDDQSSRQPDKEKKETSNAAETDDKSSRQPGNRKETTTARKEDTNFLQPEKEKRTTDVMKKDTQKKAYTEDVNFIKENHPLMIMVKCNRAELLDHPLVSALLKSKWMNIGLKFSIFNILLYAVFLVLLTGFALDLQAPYQFENSSSYTVFECPDFTKEKIPEFASYAKYGIIVLASLELIIELIEMKQMFSCKVWIYFLEIENLLEWITCSTAILFVVNATGCSDSGFRPQWQWTCGTVSVFLAWINMLFIIQKLEWFGIYVVMLYRIIKLFMKFFFVFSLLIVAFAISFHCLFQNQEHFSSIWISLMKTTSMMIGGPDFVTTFLDETVHYETISYAFFYVFMLLMAIVVINLLVGLAVNNIQEFQKDADIAKKKMQVKFALELERIATSRFILKYFVSRFVGIIHKNEETLKPNDHTWLQTKVAESWNLSESHIKQAMTAEKDTSLRVVSGLYTKFKALETNLESHMNYTEKKLAEILDKHKSKEEASKK